MTKYYIDVNGNYIGGFDGYNPPNGSIEVLEPPNNGLDIWDGYKFVTPPLTLEQIIINFENAIQQHLDDEAKLKGYDNITNACSYAGAPNPFQVEAQSFITWRGNVWAYCYGELAKVQAGTRTMPTIAQIISELPVLT